MQVEIPAELRAAIERRGGGRGGAMGNLPTERTNQVVLIFNDSESLMKPVPRGEQEPQRRPGAATDRAEPGARRAGMMARIRMSSASRADRETLVEAHTHYDEGTIVELPNESFLSGAVTRLED